MGYEFPVNKTVKQTLKLTYRFRRPVRGGDVCQYLGVDGQLQGRFLWSFFRVRCLAYLENDKESEMLPSPIGMERHRD